MLLGKEAVIAVPTAFLVDVLSVRVADGLERQPWVSWWDRGQQSRGVTMSGLVEYLIDGSRLYNTSVAHNRDSVADLSNHP